MLRELRLLEGAECIEAVAIASIIHAMVSDDLANSLCGALHSAVTAARRGQMIVAFYPSLIAPDAGGRYIVSETERVRDRIRLVHVDEHGDPLTTDQVFALRHARFKTHSVPKET